MNSTSEIREEVLKLIQQKDRMEDEIRELTSILTKNGVGMNDPLVDAEGFPINTIDVYQVRHARHRIICNIVHCLQNDHKALMKQIENGLHGYYSSAASDGATYTQPQDVEMHRDSNTTHKTPFAKVTLVTPESPADHSGIQANDLVVEFGSVNSTNFRSITDIAAVVQHSEGQQVHVKLMRRNQYVVKYLIPQKWAGKGLLGCNIVAINNL